MTIGDEKVRRYEPRMIGIEDRPYEAGMYVSLHGHYVLHSAYAELAAVPAGWSELLAMVPLPPNAITYDKGWELLDELQRLAVLAAAERVEVGRDK